MQKIDSSYLRSTLQGLGYKLKDFGNSWKTNALYRGGDNTTALSIDKNTGRFYDFVIGDGGGFQKLLKKHNLELDTSRLGQFEESLDTSPLTEETFFKDEREYETESNYSYFIGRGISFSTLKFFKNYRGTGKMQDRSCFPVFNEFGLLHGVSGRVVEKDYDRDMKWKHIGKKKFFVYPCFLSNEYGYQIGLREIRRQKSAILVESIGDTLKLWDAGIHNLICCFGVSISPSILSILIRTCVETIYICYNNDAGKKNNAGEDAAKKQREKLLDFYNEKSIVIKKPPNLRNDFGECSIQEIREWKNNFEEKENK